MKTMSPIFVKRVDWSPISLILSHRTGTNGMENHTPL